MVTEEAVQAFKAAWTRADEEGHWGSRVQEGLAAVEQLRAGAEPKAVPLAGLMLQEVPGINDPNYQAGDEVLNTDRRWTSDLDKANVATSSTSTWLHDSALHKIVLDLDVPAKLVPSSTPDHNHLYIDVKAEWSDVIDLLKALEKVGILEAGYVGASLERGYTAVRLPWVKKQVQP